VFIAEVGGEYWPVRFANCIFRDNFHRCGKAGAISGVMLRLFPVLVRPARVFRFVVSLALLLCS
jgi:hypothetical protein